MKKRTSKGFTLAELLIVVAIIAVLAAIATPIFAYQLNKAALAVDLANYRTMESYQSILKQTGSLTFGDQTITLKSTYRDIRAYCLLSNGTLSHDVLHVEPPNYIQAPIPSDAYYSQGTGDDHEKDVLLLLYIDGGGNVILAWEESVTKPK